MFLKVLSDRRLATIAVVMIIGAGLFLGSQEYHPVIYTNFSSYTLSYVNEKANRSFSFSTEGSYKTVVDVTFPSQNEVKYYIMYNASYVRNNMEHLLYYPISSGSQNHSFEFNESNVNGFSVQNYAINITSANGNTFLVNVSYTIFISNREPASPYLLYPGLIILIGSLIALAVFLTFYSSLKKEKH